MEKKNNLQYAEAEVAPPGPVASPLKRHVVRYWWMYLTIVCVTFLLVALCLIYVLVPQMAQLNIDRAYLQFTDIRFIVPTPSSITLTQTVLLYTKTRFTPTLKPFVASIYAVHNGSYSKVPMTTARFPEVHAIHPVSMTHLTNTFLNFSSDAEREEVARFATQVLTQDRVTTALVGRGSLQLGALPLMTVNYNKTTTFQGLNGLKGFGVSNVKLDVKAEPGQPNLSGMASFPNPSVLTFDMGNVTFTLSTAAAGVVGQSYIENMTIRPGVNIFPIHSVIDSTKIMQSLDPGSDTVQIIIMGNTAVYHGQSLTYYEKSFAFNKLSLALNVSSVLANS
ncbi:BgTH12-04580 [Blumeria graminis f. sp. triticale]|uniref:BgTH12-04580 n=1 Tax=Blumeria graminis f. sp. triticale TaxID=1689686 RepID=A0A9W4GAW4_BLUGR|nr:BgTH12-04580 [Blumeria graminis f. sp. triticale]